MADDDDLVVNFTLPERALGPKPIVRGGPWRERRRIERQELRKRAGAPPRKPREPAFGALDESHDTQSRTEFESGSAKRRKLDAGLIPLRYTPRNANRPQQRPNHAHGTPQVISSLFTYNPAPMVSLTEFEDDPAETASPVEPSNAPLTEEELSFTTLGVNKSLATHLTKKLDITAPTAIQKAALPKLIDGDSDAFVQAETGSGKTLAYLLPIVHRIMEFSKEVKDGGATTITRDSGLFAIVLAPTRELSKQISSVLENVLRCAHWIVGGTVIGGEKKKAEKARLRKGLNILIATPGRLADHIAHTDVLDVSQVRWLVLDEGDRLMELGFEEDIKKLVSRLDYRMKEHSITKNAKSMPKKRINILCSATMRMDVQKLGDISLKNAVHIAPDLSESKGEEKSTKNGSSDPSKFHVPSQLKQTYALIPAKLRLVSLVALLRKAFARCSPSTKIIVFFSCADSVDFHWRVLTRPRPNSRSSTPQEDEEPPSATDTVLSSALLHSETPPLVHRLHGSLPQQTRTSTLSSFRDVEEPALLLATDIASRGLDLPRVDRVIEFDPAFSQDDHVHRVGRTARAGKAGEACVMLMPGCEEGYVGVLRGERSAEVVGGIRAWSADEVLKGGFEPLGNHTSATNDGGKKSQSGFKPGPRRDGGPVDEKPHEAEATDFQLDTERWVLRDAGMLALARKAFASHVRAYATHVAGERKWFDIRELHLGHLAKGFALREAPGGVGVRGTGRAGKRDAGSRRRADEKRLGKDGDGEDGAERDMGATVDLGETRRRMEKLARGMGGGVEEFNIA